METLAYILGIVTGILSWLLIWPIFKYVYNNWLISESEKASSEYEWEYGKSRFEKLLISAVFVPGLFIGANITLWLKILVE